MFVMPDGAVLDMQWKQVVYKNHGDSISFQIIPMVEKNDIIIIPNKERWDNIKTIFPFEEREEIIFLLEKIQWKRNVHLIEADITPVLEDSLPVVEGMLEMTGGYKEVSSMYLFDPNCKFTVDQVKKIYWRVEEKFAEEVIGDITIPSEMVIPGSVVEQVVIPALMKNKKVNVIRK